MKKAIPALMVLLALAVAQQTQQTQQTQQQTPTTQNQGDVVGLTMQALAIGNNFEIASSRVALSKEVSEGVRTFAQGMIDQHTQNQQTLQQLASSKNITLPQDLGVLNQLTLNSISQLQGRAFERAYLRAQVDAHEMTVMFLETLLRSGNQAAVGTQTTGQTQQQGQAQQGQQGQTGQQQGQQGQQEQQGQQGQQQGQTGQQQGQTQNQAGQNQNTQAGQTTQAQGAPVALDNDLRQFAQTTLSTVRQHLNQARQLYTASLRTASQ